jgi:predicted MFS family arabinose efflux permease
MGQPSKASVQPEMSDGDSLMTPAKPARREIVGLGILFGTIYFAQGIGDPGDGLISQPVISLLKKWGHADEQITLFSALLALPWSFKPLYGLLTDFVPLAGYRRKSYLILNSAVTILCLGVLYTCALPPGAYLWVLSLLILPTIGISFSDVVADALMVEKGQPRGITGQLQAVQWAALNAATVLTGVLGGYLAQNRLEQFGFLLCAAVMVGTLVLSLAFVREKPQPMRRPSLRMALRTLWEAACTPTVLGVGGFLFLWNFNPFSNTVLNLYMTNEMGFSEQFYGNMQSLIAVGGFAGCVTYGFYCRRFSMASLVHAAIVLGIINTLAYWGLRDHLSAVLISLTVGFVYGTANLIGLDLAARACPPQIAGTVFALLMALSNFSIALSTWLGGIWYAGGKALWDSQTSFNLLVGVGAGFTAGCWLLWPVMRRNAAVSSQGATIASHKSVIDFVVSSGETVD